MSHPDPERAAELIHAVFAAFEARDIDAIEAVVDHDGELWPQVTAEQVGRTEPYRGPAAIRDYLDDIARAWDEFHVQPGELRVAGSGVVAFGTAHGRTGDHEIEVPVIWVFKLRGDKIYSLRIASTASEAEEELASESARSA